MAFNGALLNPVESLLSPFSLHPQDNSAIAIVLEPLDGSNFMSWSHAVKRALSVKNKALLIDGLLPPPTEDGDVVIRVAWI